MSEERNARQEPDPVAQMIAMLKDFQREVRLLKKGKTQEVRDNTPLWATKIGSSQREGRQWEGELTPST